MNARAWLQSSGMKLGTIVTIDHPAIVEIARLAGFDWLWIDGEHGRFDEVSAATACAVNSGRPADLCAATGPVSDIDQEVFGHWVRRDHSATGFVGGRCGRYRAGCALSAAWREKRGDRTGAGLWNEIRRVPAIQDYAIVVQIESTAGVRNAEAIIGHAAVDAVIIGPYDLSGSLGIPGKVDAPQVVESIAKIQAICKEAGKPCGIFAATAEKASVYAKSGFDLIAVGMDCSILLGGYEAMRARIVGGLKTDRDVQEDLRAT